MITNPNYEAPGGTVGLDYGDYERLGGLAFRQLAELRHRGASTTVSQTFAAYCRKCISSADKKIAGLIPAWYQVRVFRIYHISSSQMSRRRCCVYNRRLLPSRDARLAFQP